MRKFQNCFLIFLHLHLRLKTMSYCIRYENVQHFGGIVKTFISKTHALHAADVLK